MTAPGEPRIKINPDSVRGLKQWIEADTTELAGYIEVRYYESSGSGTYTSGAFRLSRRDWCALNDWLAQELWKDQNELAQEESPEGRCDTCGRAY